ncbi:Putative NAC domain-containing protein 94 [Dendrobium catenatum]|uniref:NAC domain-containing protein 94 n=1 Tax=Dendrobium catenatum TaxID=906689 RepID=A0A2I0V7N1_9ASPA|nr:Putative NAC domain-containing protein 94 [Dendrobium catenatum]
MERCGSEKNMPGFRFHPAEEELFEFYLRRSVTGKNRSFSIISTTNLCLYDPWDLPALAKMGERNSTSSCQGTGDEGTEIGRIGRRREVSGKLPVPIGPFVVWLIPVVSSNRLEEDSYLLPRKSPSRDQNRVGDE